MLLSNTLPLIALCLGFTIEVHTFDIEFILNYAKYLKGHKNNDFAYIVIVEADNITCDDCEKRLQQELQVPLLKANTKLDKSMRLARHWGEKGMACIFMSTTDDKVKFVAERLLRDRHNVPIIFAVKHAVNANEMQEFFQWCWRINILNAVLSFTMPNKQFAIFTYTPFPHLRVLNITEQSFDKSLLSAKVYNLQGYQFKIDIYIEPPMISITKPDFEVIGIVGEIFKAFIKRHNATYTVHSVASLNDNTQIPESQIILNVSKNLMDISLNAFPPSKFWNQSSYSYPVLQTKICLMVPLEREAPFRYYLVYVFSAYTWYVIIGTLITLFILHFTCSSTQSAVYNYWFAHFGAALLYAFNILLNQPIFAVPFKTWKYRFIFIASHFFGIIVVYSYIGSLTASFSATLPGKQLNTLSDFEATKLEILARFFDRRTYFETNFLPESLLSRLILTDTSGIIKHRFNLNTTYAYIVTTEKWQIHLYQQQRLWRPYFHMAKHLCTHTLQLCLPLQFDSPFASYLKEFTLLLYQHGFISLWKNNIKPSLSHIQHFMESSQHPIALTMQHFTYAYYIYCILISICILTFLLELLLPSLTKFYLLLYRRYCRKLK